MEREGTVFNIQRYTIDDGPGIRTELFLKGCPLSCPWCSNPESWSREPEPGVYGSKCLGREKCGFCQKVCSVPEALEFQGGKLASICRDRCINCMRCIDVCPTEAIRKWGQKMTVSQAMEIVRKDMEYYRSSGGGITLSGGEPLVQSAFVQELLKVCKTEGIHTCLESTFCAEWSIVKETVANAELLITDIKHMDPEIHKKYTGISNEKILENIKRLAEIGKEIILRIPVIPGVNDSEENMEATADFIINETGNRISQVQLLSFMRLGEEKYASLGRAYPMEGLELDRVWFQEKVQGFADYFNSRGIFCTVGTRTEKKKGRD